MSDRASHLARQLAASIEHHISTGGPFTEAQLVDALTQFMRGVGDTRPGVFERVRKYLETADA